MSQNFKTIFKIFMLTILFFLVIDLLIGKNFYKKFIRKSFTDVDAGVTMPDKIYDHKFKKNFKTSNMGWGQRRYSFCTDGNGFRTFCDNRSENKKDFDIGFIGDSFTESIGIEYNKSFVGLISLNLVDKKTGHLQTHTIRYWETQFKQIKPSIRAGKRRYYSTKDLKIINYIKFLLKEKGLTINGVKKILSENENHSIDDSLNFGVYKPGLKSSKIIRDKVKNISKIIKDIKKLKNG